MSGKQNTTPKPSKDDAPEKTTVQSIAHLNYVFLDLSADDKNINDLSLANASFSIVVAKTFETLDHNTFEFEKSKDGFKTEFQNFIQNLTDSIYAHCIQNEKKIIFVVSSGWNLRIRLIKLAKSLEVQLPIYLEYPSYFDLKKEYIKYEEHVKKVPFNSIDYKNTTLESMSKSLNINNFDNKIEQMVLIATKISSDENSGCMQNPHDMNLDLTQFFLEQSKILYMSNLSSDITQTELETFFIKFSGNAIAFWMLKNPILLDSFSTDSNGNNSIETSKTCSGFVIFSNHEDATEALIFNGEMLNERLIELQPSSLAVLDKAREILTPFPSSKNKPRPGDWNCPSCGFSNFQRRTACFRCTFPAASAATVQESLYGGDNNTDSSNSKPRNDQHLNIPYAGYYNSTNGMNTNSVNTMSNYNNNYGSNNYNYNNLNGNQNNSNSCYSSRQSSNVPFRAGDWKCLNEACCYHNFAKNTCCLKCGAPRVQSAIINGHPHGQYNNVNEKSNSKFSRNSYIMDSNNSSRSGSIPNQLNQINQNQNQNVSQFNNYNKSKNNANEIFMNSMPNTPNATRSGVASYTNNSASNSTDFLASRIGNLSLNNNNTGGNSVGSSISGSSGIPMNNSAKLESVNHNINSGVSGFNTMNTPFSVGYGLGGGNSLLGLGSNDLVGMNNFETVSSSNMNYEGLNGLGGLSSLSGIGSGLNKINDLGLPLSLDGINMGVNSGLNMNLNLGGYGNYNFNSLGNDAFGVRMNSSLGGSFNSPAAASSTPLSASNIDNTVRASSDYERKGSN